MDEWEKLPIFLKAEEMIEIVKQFYIILKDENSDNKNINIQKSITDFMMENALVIPVKLSAALSYHDIPYDLKMENATLIRKSARELMTQLRGLEIYGFPDIEYLNLLRNEIEEFRILFAEWVKTFDCWCYVIDRWGLFNPPGINYDDKDPDDDIPFNPDSYFE